MVILKSLKLIFNIIENDAMIGTIYNTVRNIKNNALEMSNKIRLSNQQVDEMEKKYTDSNNLINKTTKMLGELFSSNTNYWCYLCIFILVVFFFLYKITH